VFNQVTPVRSVTWYLQKSSSAKIVCQITDKNMSDDTRQCP